MRITFLEKKTINPGKLIRTLRKLLPKNKDKSIIWYQDFIEIVLRHKLEFHIKHLTKIRTTFRKFDPENHGTISSENLKKLLNEIRLPASIKAADIFTKTNAEKLGKVTFSDLIEALTAFYVDKGAVLMTVLQWCNEN